MSSPPIAGKRSVGKKRKRGASSSKLYQSGDVNSVFLSQSAHLAAQLELAGASETDLDSTSTIPNFPHRGFGRRGGSSEPEPEENPDAQEGARRGNPRPRENDRKGHLDILLRSIEHFMNQGEISKAARAYGLVLQMRPRSLPIDVRSYNLWAMGAEILMRQGEEQQWRNRDGDDHRTPAARKNRPGRWGSSANIGRVRAYFETLVRQFPYDRRYPDLISAVDFWLSLLSCEIYNTHAEYVLSLAALDDDGDEHEGGEVDERYNDLPTYYEGYSADEDLNRGGTYLGHLGDIGTYPSPQKSTLPERKDNFRVLALESMRDIIQRLEKLMEDAPYTKNEHFLRLRAVASLFASDLCMPLSPAPAAQLREAGTRRILEQRAALHAIQELKNLRTDSTAPMAEVHLEAFYLKEEHLLHRPANVYPSLPIRRGL